MKMKINSVLKDQSGVALVIALIMIVILTLIGLASTYSSIFEIKLSGNKRGATNAFYAADGGAQSIQADINNFDVPGKFLTVDVNTLPDDLKREPIDKQHTSPSLPLPVGVNFIDPPKVTIYHTTQAGVPRGVGYSAINFDYEHYIIDSIGKDQMDLGLLRSNCEVREKVVRLVPTLQGGY